MVTFDITSCIDEFYTYRTAVVESSLIIHLDQKECNMIRNYVKEQGYKPDNHICWKNKDGMCFMYSDRTLIIGLSIIKRNW